MKNEKLLEIEQLFCALDDWSPQLTNMDSFVIHNLDILSVITEDHDNVKNMAMDLSLLLKARPETRESLKEQFSNIENSLEEDLRGFSSLLDMVLEENTIRLNTCELLESLPSNLQVLADQYSHLVRQIDALMDLEMAFDIGRPKALSLLFLLTIKEILSIKFGWSKSTSRSLLIDWLSNKNNLFAAIFRADIDFFELFSVLRHCQSERVGWEEILLAFLAKASTEQFILPAHSFVMLDGMLLRMGLEGLLPLLESGFVTIEGFSKSENTAKILHVV